MKRFLTSIIIILIICSCTKEEMSGGEKINYPEYGPELEVSIAGLSSDAMEPFISPDGQFLFYNNLNDGITTKLFYSTRVNDSIFTLIGELEGPNQSNSPYLNAVADMDSKGNFYWTSVRDYPQELDNLFRGTFNAGAIADIGRIRGNFNMNTPGWLVMDHGISEDGKYLYYNNARFDENNCEGPCETIIGIAEKVDDFTFDVIPDSQKILENINDDNYIYYAPCISTDNLEFYYTRFLKGAITPGTIVEICVAVRDSPEKAFSIPKVLFSDVVSNIVEAPTLTSDKNIMYYHKKIDGTHKILMRYRKF